MGRLERRGGGFGAGQGPGTGWLVDAGWEGKMGMGWDQAIGGKGGTRTRRLAGQGAGRDGEMGLGWGLAGGGKRETGTGRDPNVG